LQTPSNAWPITADLVLDTTSAGLDYILINPFAPKQIYVTGVVNSIEVIAGDVYCGSKYYFTVEVINTKPLFSGAVIFPLNWTGVLAINQEYSLDIKNIVDNEDSYLGMACYKMVNS
jgi:hypothetical protein